MVKQQSRTAARGAVSALFLICFLGQPLATASADYEIEDVWLTEPRDAHVEIAPCDQDPLRLCGQIIWLADPLDENGKPQTDANNPDPDLQTRPVIGLTILKGFEQKDENKWTRGTIYNPEDGNTYSSRLSFKNPDTLVVEGCVLFLCRKQIWERVAMND